MSTTSRTIISTPMTVPMSIPPPIHAGHIGQYIGYTFSFPHEQRGFMFPTAANCAPFAVRRPNVTGCIAKPRSGVVHAAVEM